MESSDDLHHRYLRLRQQLDAAYAAADWDSSRIDRITEQMAPIERALSSSRRIRSFDAAPPFASGGPQGAAA